MGRGCGGGGGNKGEGSGRGEGKGEREGVRDGGQGRGGKGLEKGGRSPSYNGKPREGLGQRVTLGEGRVKEVRGERKRSPTQV